MTENMFRRFRASLPQVACVCVLLFVASAQRAVFAAVSGPVILTESTTTRAIAVDAVTKLRDPFPLTTPGYTVGADKRTRVMLFVLNLDVFAGESANSLVVEAEDGAGRKYAFTVEHITSVPRFEALKQVVVRLSDDIGDAGDLLVRVSLHGMASNRARISVGHTGGGLPDDPGSTPNPAPVTPPAPTPTPTLNTYTGAATTADTVRFLEQATWGPTNAEIARAQAMGFRAYLNEQFAAPASSYPNLTLFPVDNNLGCPTDANDPNGRNNCLRDNYSMYPLQRKFFQNALETGAQSDQLRQRVAFALHQIFVVSGVEINQPSWMSYYLQILDRHAFGNFRNLLQEMTLNPGMGRYLDTVGNTRTNPNENYAREVLQLFSIGLDELNRDGTPKLDAQGKRIPTYDQAEITSFARVFTGWVFAAPPAGTQGVINYREPMVAREQNHDTAAKQLLNGVVLPANQNTGTDLNGALDNIFNHPNVGPFIGKQLIQHLVTSNSSPGYVERVARVFNNDCDALYPDNCANARGDLKAVVRAVLLDPEARGDLKTDPNYGRLREPVQLLTNALRACNATGDGVLANRSSGGDLPNSLGQPLFMPATVFSYYSPGYEVPGAGLTGPAFEILSTSTALRRANVLNQLIYTGINAGANNPTGTRLDLTSLESLAGDPAQLVAALDSLLMHNTMSPAARDAIIAAVINTGTDARKRAQAAVYLVASSHQYQVQR